MASNIGLVSRDIESQRSMISVTIPMFPVASDYKRIWEIGKISISNYLSIEIKLPVLNVPNLWLSENFGKLPVCL